MAGFLADELAEMPKPSDGFYLGQALKWGTTYETITGAFPFGTVHERWSARWRIAELEFDRAYGFPLVHAEFTAGNSTRPILSAGYEIDACVSADPMALPEEIVEGVSFWLGRNPVTQKADLTRSGRLVTGAVAASYLWEDADVRLHLSVYGAPRIIRGGRSAGALYLRWENEVRAAEPYLPELLQEEANLALLCEQAEIAAILPVGSVPKRFGTPIDPNKAFDPLLAKSQICLRRAHVLETPLFIQQQIVPARIALWRNAGAGKWGVSTYWDTGLFQDHIPTKMEWAKRHPAKGPGSSRLRIGEDLWLEGPIGSPEIAAIALALQSMPHVYLNISEDDDY